MAVLAHAVLRGCILAAAALLAIHAPVRSAPLTEAQVKAGLLYNFITFVEWPAGASTGQAVFVIGIAGKDPVTAALRPIRGETFKGRRIDVWEVDNEADARRCQILFVPASSDREAPALLAALRDEPVLTVGEHEQFTRLGGVIRVYPERSRLRLEIDLARAQRAGLRISSRLLDLSRVVKDGHAVR